MHKKTAKFATKLTFDFLINKDDEKNAINRHFLVCRRNKWMEAFRSPTDFTKCNTCRQLQF